MNASTKGPLAIRLLLAATALLAGCDGGAVPADEGDPPANPLVVVNSLQDVAEPPEGVVTLRSAIEAALPDEPVLFDASLDGAVIELSVVAEEHSVLKGEVMGMRMEPSGPVSYLVGWFERDYGRSALYARKNVVIDASALPSGVTLAWTGGDDDPARVLAVYGDLTMINVAVTGGRSHAAELPVVEEGDQPWTLARGAGVAVWGTARLARCTLFDNRCLGDFDSSRDRGAFGGGLYADAVELEDCVISGNTVLGGGAAGGGVYCVGGAGYAVFTVSTLERCAVTGNAIRALFTYGGGVYSDGGGIGKSCRMEIANCTIARNLAEPAPGLPGFLLAMGYWRGGGVYTSNGYLTIRSCTIAENEVRGYPRTDSRGRRNLAGGIAATVGDAHAVDTIDVGRSIIVGNLVRELGEGGVVADAYAHDLFTGSVFAFLSLGYNRIGVIDFSQALVPVGEWGWESLCRRHYPKEGDEDGVEAADVLDLETGVTVAETILSAGVAPGELVPLRYRPRGTAVDAIPAAEYEVDEVRSQYRLDDGATDDFLPILLGRIEVHFDLAGFAPAFTAEFENWLASVDTDPDEPGLQPYLDPDGSPILTLADTLWFGPGATWPRESWNQPYIEFWHRLDPALAAEAIPGMGPEVLGDDAWTVLFTSGPLAENPGITVELEAETHSVVPEDLDQAGTERPVRGLCDVGAVEAP